MTKKTWTEPLIRKLVATNKGADPECIIERYTACLLKETEQDELPIDVELIASCLGIRRRTGNFDFAGRIFAEPSGQLVMDLNAGDRPPRRRFTCAHELIHPAFPGFKRETRYRVDSTTANHQPNREEEYLCDLGAAALLMPARLVKDRFDIRDGLNAMERLSDEAQVSCEAAGNRLVSLADDAAVFFVMDHSHKPADRPALQRGEEVPKRLRTRYARAAHLDTYLPRFKSAPDDSVLFEAWNKEGVVCGREPLPGAERAGLFEIQAKSYGAGDTRRVLAMAVPRR
jgi:hypothetical protein